MLEVVGREAPHIHRDRRVLCEYLFLTSLIGESDLPICTACNRGALDDPREESLVIDLADTACYRTAFAERITHTIAYHAVLIRAVGEATELVGQGCEAMTAVEVIGIDHRKRLVDDLSGHHHSVVRSPRFLTAFGYGEAFGQLV